MKKRDDLVPGMPVYVRSNEWAEPLQSGTFQGVGMHNIPTVMINGTLCLCLGQVLPITERLTKMLEGNSAREQWSIMKKEAHLDG